MFDQLTSVAIHVVESSPHSNDSTAHEQQTCGYYDIEQRGFSILPSMFSQDETGELVRDLGKSAPGRSKAGIRNALRHEAIRDLAARTEAAQRCS